MTAGIIVFSVLVVAHLGRVALGIRPCTSVSASSRVVRGVAVTIEVLLLVLFVVVSVQFVLTRMY